MSPLKNTNKFFSDCLPPALVKDWRQCFRSRSSVALFILLLVAGWVVFGSVVADSDQTPSRYLKRMEDMGGMLYGLGVFALGLIIPFRAGSTVSADTRVRSSNFLMLTPLSARRIVWGTWSSTALILLLAGLLSLPLLFARRLMMTAYPHVGEIELAAVNWTGVVVDSMLLTWLVLIGWVMAGFYMFSAALPRVLRVLMLLFFGMMAVETLVSSSLFELFGITRSEGSAMVHQLPEFFPLALCVLDAALLLVLFLELARRHYAAPAENCSRAVRLLAPLPLLIYGGLLALAFYGYKPVNPDSQCGFAIIYLFIALLSDALLPIYAMPSHAWKLWRGMPGWLQRPGFVPSTICLALGCLVFILPSIVHAFDEKVFDVDYIYKGVYVCMNVGMSVMLWLLITDCFCSRTAGKRPLVFGVVAFACYLASACIAMPLDGYPLVEAALPLCGGELGSGSDADLITVSMVDGGIFLLLLMVLIFWRGSVRK